MNERAPKESREMTQIFPTQSRWWERQFTFFQEQALALRQTKQTKCVNATFRTARNYSCGRVDTKMLSLLQHLVCAPQIRRLTLVNRSYFCSLETRFFCDPKIYWTHSLFHVSIIEPISDTLIKQNRNVSRWESYNIIMIDTSTKYW